MNLSLILLRFLPKNLLSAAFGCFAALRLPRPLNDIILAWFAKRYRVRIEEASKPLSEYHSLLDFFVRDLKAGLRPIGEDVVSPVDGTISELGVIRGAELLQAKGKSYSLLELLQDRELAQRFDGGFYITLYLAPGDYHHIHSPVCGGISRFIAVPGTLWPVSAVSVQAIPGVFCKNERVISCIESRDFGTVAVVKVGATNVGSIALTYDPFVANRLSLRRLFIPERSIVRREYRERIPIDIGARLGTFRLGSTVVLLFEPGRFSPGPNCCEGRIIYGTKLGAKPE